MTRNKALALLVGLTLIGFALHLYRIDTVSFRGDEAFTVLNWTSHPLSETLQSEIPLRDPQPPLTFALFRGWALLFGTSEFSMRLLPALFSLPGIAAVYALGKRLGGRSLGLLAALLWTLHPFLIYHAQDAKAYAIWASCSAIAVWLALRALAKDRRLDWLLYIIAASIAAYLYYLELFTLLALNLYVLLCWRSRLRSWLLSQVAIALLLAPWYVQPRLLFGSGYGGTASSFDPAQVFSHLLPTLTVGQTIPQAQNVTAGLAISLLLLLGLLALWRINHRDALLIGLIAVLPLAALSLVSLKLNVFAPRYVLSAIPAYVLIVASLIVLLWRSTSGANRLLTVGIAVVIVGVQAYGLNNYYFDPALAKAPDWRSLTQYLHAHVGPDDLAVQTAADEAFTLYYADFTDFKRLPANPDQSEAEITGVLEHAAQTYHSIWLVANPPPGWPNGGIPEDWLSSHMQEIRHSSLGGLPVQQFMSWTPNIEESTLAVFEDTAQLVAVELDDLPDPDGNLTVLVYWRPIQPTERSFKVFVHLLGMDTNPATGSPLWSQDDHYPQQGRIDTTSWSAADVYRDVFHIPVAGLPPGPYTLEIGFYEPESSQRVPLTTGGDSYTLGALDLP